MRWAQPKTLLVLLIGLGVVGPPSRGARAICLPAYCHLPVQIAGVPDRDAFAAVRIGRLEDESLGLRFQGGLSNRDVCDNQGALFGFSRWSTANASRDADGGLRLVATAGTAAPEMIMLDRDTMVVTAYDLHVSLDGQLEGTLDVEPAAADAGPSPGTFQLTVSGPTTILDGPLATDNCNPGDILTVPLADGSTLDLPCVLAPIGPAPCDDDDGSCGGCG